MNTKLVRTIALAALGSVLIAGFPASGASLFGSGSISGEAGDYVTFALGSFHVPAPGDYRFSIQFDKPFESIDLTVS